MIKIRSSEITPEHVFRSRRSFLKGLGLGIGALALGACSPRGGASATDGAPQPAATLPAADGTTDELGDALTSFEAVTNYNNYYEFSTNKEAVARLAQDFPMSPWMVAVGGLVNKPRVFDIDDLRTELTQQERIYRLRCVEAWSMVIPWQGFRLADLLAAVEPTSAATHVRFETLMDTNLMPGQKSQWYTWPYVEGLRMDEAMNDLTLMATGLYGQTLPPQNGGPLRLVAPWKYGFKSIKGIVKIDLVDYEPRSLWMNAAPNEYGFYANVNPEVNHPRWSQASERRIGETGRRPTLPFNGYADEVAGLYAGLDLKANY